MVEESDAWVKPTYIMTVSHQNKLFPLHRYLTSQLFHYCPALSFCQHKKYQPEVPCAWTLRQASLLQTGPHVPRLLLPGAYILVLGNPMPAVVAYTEGRREVIAQGNPRERADLPRAAI